MHSPLTWRTFNCQRSDKVPNTFGGFIRKFWRGAEIMRICPSFDTWNLSCLLIISAKWAPPTINLVRKIVACVIGGGLGNLLFDLTSGTQTCNGNLINLQKWEFTTCDGIIPYYILIYFTGLRRLAWKSTRRRLPFYSETHICRLWLVSHLIGNQELIDGCSEIWMVLMDPVELEKIVNSTCTGIELDPGCCNHISSHFYNLIIVFWRPTSLHLVGDGIPWSSGLLAIDRRRL